MGADQTRVCKDNHENATLKNVRSIDDCSPRGLSLQRKANVVNNTGLPNNLKNGVEALSGYSLDNVRVHYNSSKPAAVQAYAYTQGTDIHIAPGQESCLPHEAWHVTQQMSGRVSPTTSIGGVAVNDDAALEHEADVMGAKAVQCKGINGGYSSNLMQLKALASGCQVRQLKLIELEESQPFEYEDKNYNIRSVDVGKKMVARLSLDDPDIRKGEDAGKNRDQNAMMSDYRRKAKLNGNQLVKGHLLNEYLGGKAKNSNLYPITDGANFDHLGYVENYVKKLVLAGRIVKYEVEAGPCGNELCNTGCQKSQFRCHYKTEDFNGESVDKYVTIISNIVGGDKPSRGSAWDASNGKYLKEGDKVNAKGCYESGLNHKIMNYLSEDIEELINSINARKPTGRKALPKQPSRKALPSESGKSSALMVKSESNSVIMEIIDDILSFIDYLPISVLENLVEWLIDEVFELFIEYVLPKLLNRIGCGDYLEYVSKRHPGLENIFEPINFVEYLYFKYYSKYMTLDDALEFYNFVNAYMSGVKEILNDVDDFLGVNIRGVVDAAGRVVGGILSRQKKYKILIGIFSCLKRIFIIVTDAEEIEMLYDHFKNNSKK